MAKAINHTFTLTFKRGSKGYTVEATGSNGVQVAPQPFAWRLSAKQKATFQALSKNSYVPPEDIEELGKTLYAAVFVPAIATAYGQAQASVTGDQGMRIQLRLGAPELALIPWEAMYDGETFIATRSEYPLVRMVPLPKDTPIRQRLQVRGPLRILFVESWPKDLPAFHRDVDPVDKLRESLGELIQKRRVVFDELRDATLAELRETLLQDYHIVYFAGHGDASAGIYLEDEDGYKSAVSAEALVQMLEGKSTRLVFLNASHTDATPTKKGELSSSFARALAIKAGLPAVIAMQYEISNEQAVTLENLFFASLAASYSVEQALAEARKALLHNGQAGRDVISPVMYLMAKDGHLFRRATNWTRIGFVVALVGIVIAIAATIQTRQNWQQVQVEPTEHTHGQATTQPEATAEVYVQATKQLQATAQSEAIAPVVVDEIAEARRLAEQARYLVDNQGESELQIGALLAIESLHYYPESAANQVLATALELLPPKADITTGREITRLTHEGYVEAVTFSPDGHWVASGSWGGGGMTRVWEATTGHEISRRNEAASSVAFSPDGQWVVSGGFEGAWVWEAATGLDVSQITHEGDVNAVAFSPDGQWVVSGGCDVGVTRLRCESGSLRVWEAATGRVIAQTPQEFGVVSSVAFSPDGQQVVSGNWNRTVQVWEAKTGHEILKIAGECDVATVAFSSDGQWIIAGDLCNNIWIWDADTGNVVNRMQHEDAITSIDISSDDQWIVFGSWDNTARVWEIATGREIARMDHPGAVYDVAFSPDDRWVVSGSQDGTISVWWWQPEDLIEMACARLTRNLTRREWTQYLGDRPYRAICPNLPIPEE